MHRYTAEIIYHFECDLCHQWWSYAVTPTSLTNYNMNLPSDEKVHCMHCGQTKEVEVKPNVHVSDWKTSKSAIPVENNARYKIAGIIDKEISDAMKIRK
tara:strand:- start:160 stop:456 length:297 start_codon:yes stop_codon:yes gene_type:complete